MVSEPGSEDTHHWMVWFTDDTLDPIGVAAPTRHAARRVGEQARTSGVAAAVREDEGAATDLTRINPEHLSTPDDPHRFIHEVLHARSAPPA